MAHAGVDDVALYVDELRADPPADLVAKTAALLEDAEDVVLGVAADLEARLADGRMRERTLIRVEAEMVAGVLQNPNCYISESQSVGGVSLSRTLDLKTATGRLRLSDDQREQLGLSIGARSSGGGRAFTVEPGPGQGGRRAFDVSWPG